MKKFSLGLTLAAVVATASGCIVNTGTAADLYGATPVGTTQSAGSGRAPIIQALSHSPATAGKNDTITFTIVASDMENDVLQYNWAATKGLLTSNSGQVVAWKPTKADGSFESGLATVSVIISDGRSTTTGSVNIMIDNQGQATVTSPTTAASAAPVASTAPTAAPTATPSAAATATAAPTAEPTAAPTAAPTTAPTAAPTADATQAPST